MLRFQSSLNLGRITLKNSKKIRRRGFTLIEIMLVMAIIVILASFAVVAIGRTRARAHVNQARIQVGAVAVFFLVPSLPCFSRSWSTHLCHRADPEGGLYSTSQVLDQRALGYEVDGPRPTGQRRVG